MIQDIVKVAQSRKTVKAFDDTKRLSDAQLEAAKSLLQLAPSSLNLQPWHFIIAQSEGAKARMAKACVGGFAYNAPKVLKSSQTVLFCVKTEIDEEFAASMIAQEAEDGRYADSSVQDERTEMVMGAVRAHRDTLKDVDCWLEKQLYLNLGAFLLGVAALGIDATPMEGFDRAIMNKEFDLEAQNLRSSVMVALGFSDANADFNAKLPKSRFDEKVIIEVI